MENDEGWYHHPRLADKEPWERSERLAKDPGLPTAELESEAWFLQGFLTPEPAFPLLRQLASLGREEGKPRVLLLAASAVAQRDSEKLGLVCRYREECPWLRCLGHAARNHLALCRLVRRRSPQPLAL